MKIRRIDHIAIICSDYEKSKHFYTHILGLTILQETFRKDKNSYKLDLAINGEYQIELFSFPNPPQRLTYPEALGLRHLAFEIDDLDEAIVIMKKHSITTEDIRKDFIRQKRFVFIFDPDGLPIELYEE